MMALIKPPPGGGWVGWVESVLVVFWALLRSRDGSHWAADAAALDIELTLMMLAPAS
jgi:hypothetical protein